MRSSSELQLPRHHLFLPSLLAALVVGLAVLPGPATAARGDVDEQCSETSAEMKSACGYEARDDLAIATAYCENLPSEPEREKCEKGAKKAKSAADKECSEQLGARQNLCKGLGEAPYHPVIDPRDFLSPGDTAAHPNPYFPLVPGTTRVYQGGGEVVRVTVTDQTRVILGVTCTVVHDLVQADGVNIEDTEDYYAQDRDGNVWYFGEIAQNFEDGRLADLEGSWIAGLESAKPGLIMKAAPAVGDVYRQEFALGNAEDAARVLSKTGSVQVPAASCNKSCLVTEEFTPVEPDVLEHKYYAKGIGLLMAVHPDTGEKIELVEIID